METDGDDLGDKVIEDVLHKGALPFPDGRQNIFKRIHRNSKTNPYPVNAATKQHNRIVYSSQAIHHVAHQIASLYRSAISEEGRRQSAFANGIEKTADLSRHM